VSDPPSAPASVHPAVDFAAFVEQQYDRVRRWLSRQLKPQDVGDVLADTFIRAQLSRDACRDPTRWIDGIARNVVREHWRQEERRRKHRNAWLSAYTWGREGQEERASFAADQEERAEKLELIQALQLHPDLVTATGLVLGGATWEQAAEKLDVSSRWLRVLRERARRRRDELQQHEREGGG